MNKNLQLSNKLLLLTEYGTYLLILFLFMDKGETLRAIGIYIPPLLIFVRAIFLKENPLNFKNIISILTIFLCLSGIISSIFAPDPLYSLKWFQRTYLKLFLVYLSISYVFQTQQKLEKLSRLFVFLSVLFTIFTFYDFYTKVLPNSYNYGKFVRKYIVPLEFFLPFIPFFITTQKTKLLKVIGFVILLLGIIAIILTGSRGGWISVSLSLFIWLIGYLLITKKKFIKILPIISGIIVVIVILLTVISPPYVKGNFKELLEGYTSLRKEMVWPAAIDSYYNLSLINKIFGNGLGRMTYLEDFKKWYLNKFGKEPEELYSPHNVYLSILYKQGILGISIFLLLIYFSFKYFIANLTTEQILSMKLFSLSLISVLTILLVHGIVEDTRFIQLILIIPLIGAYVNFVEKIKK
ncbi:O-antigen ligase family protein [Thermodesulfovibrio sp. 3907-1M]|uniref:O-antigen ligase family protein n=1 Tax=Thermodesulfovibrio autotrophicus TaxID=3118333 RepID=A0AAU8GYY1_9BACT